MESDGKNSKIGTHLHQQSITVTAALIDIVTGFPSHDEVFPAHREPLIQTVLFWKIDVSVPVVAMTMCRLMNA